MRSTAIFSQTEKVREFIKHFRVEIEEGVAIRTFLLAASDDRVAKVSLDRPAHLHNLIGKALLQRQLMLLMRLYNHERRDRACLMALFSLLNVPEVRRAVTAQGSQRGIEAAVELWEILRDDPRKDSLRKICDSVSAHNLLEASSNLDQISYDAFWDFSKNTESLVEYLAIGSGMVLARLAIVEEIWSKRAREYWRSLAQ